MQIDILNEMLLLTSKPYIWLLNLSENDYKKKKNKWLPKIKVRRHCRTAPPLHLKQLHEPLRLSPP